MRRSILATVAVALLALAGPPRTYSPSFKRVPGTAILSGSRYLAILGVAGQVRLIDRSTGRAVTISVPGCSPDAVGGAWLAITCVRGGEGSYALDEIPAKRIIPLTPAPGLTSAGCGIGCQSIAGIGMDWIALTGPCADITKCPTEYSFQNLFTGVITADPVNRTTRLDLDSPRLAEPVCRPLSVPRDDERIEGGLYPGWGSVTLDGSYGITAGNEGVYLQRCGSLTRTFLTRTPAGGTCPARACPPTSNRSVVVWQDAAGRLGGIFLKSLRRFQIAVPATVDPLARRFPAALQDPYTLALAGSSLYLEDDTLGTVWTVRMPSAR